MPVVATFFNLLSLGGCDVIPIQHNDGKANSWEKVNDADFKLDSTED